MDVVQMERRGLEEVYPRWSRRVRFLHLLRGALPFRARKRRGRLEPDRRVRARYFPLTGDDSRGAVGLLRFPVARLHRTVAHNTGRSYGGLPQGPFSMPRNSGIAGTYAYHAI